jgi:hypothetical protein
MTNKESGVIETPVEWEYSNGLGPVIYRDADGTVLEPDQIAQALNTAAATEQRLAAYTDALDLALAVIEDYEQWLPRTSTNRDVKEANRQRIQQALAQHPSQSEVSDD